MKNALLLLALVAAMSASAQEAPAAEPVDVLLNRAYKQATAENKKILIIFHASWCGWCKKMDASLNDPSVKAYFDKNYVITHVTVLESPNKKQLENVGGEEYLIRQGGKDMGLPYWVVLDGKGNQLANAQMKPGENSGCPASAEEVAHFVSVLKKTSGITDAQAEAVTKRFRRNAD